ncbi:MAG: hypothetical protein ABI557_10395, partial [Aureliella sp.]
MRSHSCVFAKAVAPARLRGFTLIETLVAISFGSSIMLTAVALVHTAFNLRSQTQLRYEQASRLDRVVEQFRRDANLAVSVEVPTPKSLKLFSVGDQQVEYIADENRITRQSYIGDKLWQVEQVPLELGRTAQFSLVRSGRCVVLDILERDDNQLVDGPR